jgi:hypothetical protein
VEKEMPLEVKKPVQVHGEFRHARLTPQGTLLVAHMQQDKVVEYDSDGHVLWQMPALSPWSADPLANGNVLITDRVGVREVTRRGDTVWSWTPADAAGGSAPEEWRHGDQQLGERVDEGWRQRSGVGAGD